jgi:hypothetical protein
MEVSEPAGAGCIKGGTAAAPGAWRQTLSGLPLVAELIAVKQLYLVTVPAAGAIAWGIRLWALGVWLRYVRMSARADVRWVSARPARPASARRVTLWPNDPCFGAPVTPALWPR